MLIYRLAKPVATVLARRVWRASLTGENRLSAGYAAVLCSNHASVAETWMLPALMRRPVHILAKDSLFTRPGAAGWVARRFLLSVCVIPVNRSGGGTANGTLDSAAEVLREGELIGVYPEGTRSPDGRLFKGKTGAVRVALAGGAPIHPVAIHGAFQAGHGRSVFPRLQPRIRIEVGEAIDLRTELEALRAEQVGDRHAEPMGTLQAEQPGDRRAERSDPPKSGEGADGMPASVGCASGAPASQEEIRALTDLVMARLAAMTGQEQVDEYAVDHRARMRKASAVMAD
ncbi:1-acyl-sn-glycerol-3-phosphate acyltransferase [Helcobacillus massiliensis]|uniref:lysophospholipid acyltransferase family protein n=1 Tax=Helcobacillus TaxID=1161125 RepID=UPI001EF606C9|nr:MULTISPECIES: lysophospholipid acyltransferase family protein [Helcobacillus]MCG7426504.1 1-acyl-sn-glycerol-3-phosphate acyltransferase [Helcobacillus sp. ACRRO]MCT1556915.1 1-acyl-sn-glycerol-3-phosphate acyltransferase [Helcobacillus massiliensis]MCT2035304.1 1-acyl-sn-glycerol-3-phosphate acyltransferase [Helcobacillus massiliensis]MCT2331481.1 1-acyl-sn-glycerol-3-phosphate acyltransferase [Helcobacillus massiliensis]MDK7740985.1 lysophospholipid acyltransferase family protein [Helcoba